MKQRERIIVWGVNYHTGGIRNLEIIGMSLNYTLHSSNNRLISIGWVISKSLKWKKDWESKILV